GAEGRAGHVPRLERSDRLAQRRGEALRVGFVGVALEGRRQLELPFDSAQTGRDDRREREIRVDVAPGNPRLDALRASMSDDAKPARAVVVPPGERRRRPAAGRVALVRVDRRREKDRELLEACDLPCEEALEERV